MGGRIFLLAYFSGQQSVNFAILDSPLSIERGWMLYCQLSINLLPGCPNPLFNIPWPISEEYSILLLLLFSFSPPGRPAIGLQLQHKLFELLFCKASIANSMVALYFYHAISIFFSTDQYLFLGGGKEFRRMFRSPPLHAAEVKCIRFWFRSRGKYYKRSLQLVVNSSDTNYSSVIWSINEENQEWTYIQLPLHENVGEVFQVINENSKSSAHFLNLHQRYSPTSLKNVQLKRVRQ